MLAVNIKSIVKSTILMILCITPAVRGFTEWGLFCASKAQNKRRGVKSLSTAIVSHLNVEPHRGHKLTLTFLIFYINFYQRGLNLALKMSHAYFHAQHLNIEPKPHKPFNIFLVFTFALFICFFIQPNLNHLPLWHLHHLKMRKFASRFFMVANASDEGLAVAG